jgi:hypothetical protein
MMGSSERDSGLHSQDMVARMVTNCQYIFLCTRKSFEWGGLVRMVRAEVAGMEGVGGEFNGLIRLWKCVEKCSGGWRLEIRS